MKTTNRYDIKKGWECCANPSLSYCSNCAYHNAIGCNEMLCIDVLTLITEQENEIEYRKKQYDNQVSENTRLHIEYDKAFERLKAQQREIDRLKAENEELTKVVSSKVYDLIDNTKEIADARDAWEKQAKIDVLNELKKKTYVNDYCREVVELEKIDELIKEAQND